MDVVTGIAQGVAALAGVGKIANVRSRANLLQSKVEGHLALLEKLPDESASRQVLVDHVDELIGQMVCEECEAMGSKRQWNSIFLATLGAGGFGVWAWVSSPLWLQIPLWVLAALFAVSLFGLVTTPKPRKQPEPDEIGQQRPSEKNLRAAS
ncbi:MAG: hypothetical protein ACRDST_23430 [Pseudonocardiaceae bacterium]